MFAIFLLLSGVVARGVPGVPSLPPNVVNSITGAAIQQGDYDLVLTPPTEDTSTVIANLQGAFISLIEKYLSDSYWFIIYGLGGC